MARKLSAKEKRFCEAYCVDWNATKAALSAGYAKKSARSQASRMLTKDNIKAYIAEFQKDLAKASGLSALLVLQKLKAIVMADPSKLRANWETLKDWKELSEEERSVISEIVYDEKHGISGHSKTVKLKTYDKLKAIEVINKMLGFNEPDKIDLNQTNVPMDLSKLSTKEIKELSKIQSKLKS